MSYRNSAALIVGAIIGAVLATIIAIALGREDAAVWLAVGT